MTENPHLTRRDLMKTTALVAAGATVAGCGTTSSTMDQAATSPKADYSVPSRVTGLRVPATVTVVGCGGFGAWPALLAALAGTQNIILIDRGIVDAHDLAKAPFRPVDVGKAKAEALRSTILSFRPDASVQAIMQFVTPEHIDMLKGVVFDGTNDERLAAYLPDAIRQRGQTYVTGFYSDNLVGVAQNHISGLTFKTGNEVPVWAGSGAFSGALALYSAFVEPITFVGTPASLNMATDRAATALRAVSFVDK